MRTEFEEMLHTMERVWQQAYLHNWADRYYQLLKDNHDTNRFTYLGINFSGNKIAAVKFYAHTFKPVSEAQSSFFLPATDELKVHTSSSLVSKPLSLRNAGIAFTLKYYHEQNKPVHGFFAHTTNIDDAFTKHKLHDTIHHSAAASYGINYEYNPAGVRCKHYLYFTDAESCLKLRGYFCVPYFSDNGLYEFAFDDKYMKLNVYGWQAITQEVLANHFSKTQYTFIQNLNEKYGLYNPGCGLYAGADVKSIYFFADKIIPGSSPDASVNSDIIGKMRAIHNMP
ncbi:MAG: hypothetical protein NZM35_05905 [Chitinophagales bacterium]|nr:hypothetical protein [Chitinophagales bacterium]MDW8419439.1 hypothetical protein [Chitinophagales bacterium]